jgi:hypothetical protein
MAIGDAFGSGLYHPSRPCEDQNWTQYPNNIVISEDEYETWELKRKERQRRSCCNLS